jgi:hypothetical protein
LEESHWEACHYFFFTSFSKSGQLEGSFLIVGHRVYFWISFCQLSFLKTTIDKYNPLQKTCHLPRTVTMTGKVLAGKHDGVDLSKYVPQVRITLRFHHFHFKFGWNSFDINVQ